MWFITQHEICFLAWEDLCCHAAILPVCSPGWHNLRLHHMTQVFFLLQMNSLVIPIETKEQKLFFLLSLLKRKTIELAFKTGAWPLGTTSAVALSEPGRWWAGLPIDAMFMWKLLLCSDSQQLMQTIHSKLQGCGRAKLHNFICNYYIAVIRFSVFKWCPLY